MADKPNTTTAATEDQELVQLREAAMAHDRAALGDADTGDRKPEQPAEEVKTQPVEPKPEAAAKTKADKEQARKEKTWKEINEEKDRIRSEREALEATRKELEDARSRATELTRTDEDRQADELERIAQEYASEGKDDVAKIAKEKAITLRKTGQFKTQQAQQLAFQKEWRSHFDKAAEVDPDLHDTESPLYKAVDALVRKERMLQMVPDGVPKAVEYVKARIAMANASDLEKKLGEATKQIDELNKKLALGGSFPQSPADEKTFDDLSPKDQEAWLIKAAAKFDREQTRF
jgi:hypothetical protein